MSISYKLTSEDKNAIYEIRDALMLGSNSLEPGAIRELGKKLDGILRNLPEDVSEKWQQDSAGQRKKAAMALGMLCQGMEDLSDLATKERKGISLESKRRVTKSGGILAYSKKMQAEGLRAIKSLGFAKSDIKVMDFD